MRMTIRVLASGAALSGLLAFSSSGWAQTVAERAELRQKTEKQIAKLEDEAATLPADPIPAGQVKVATRLLEFARKALDNRNEKAAKVFTDQAEQMLKIAAGTKAVQQ